MAIELATLARPYAEAAFARAAETDAVDQWSDMIRLLGELVADPDMARIVDDPRVDRAQLDRLLMDIAGDRLSVEGANFLRVLLSNRRLGLLPQIEVQFDALKREHRNALEIHVVSAYAVSATQQRRLSEALSAHFGKSVSLTTEKDPQLIGGVKIRAGDRVIDYSLRGELDRLAAQLEI